MLTPPFKALVVDDDPVARKMVGFALEREDFRCTYAFDGADALTRIAGEQFDLVVTDLRMPNKHGHALAVELIARENAPVIVVHSSVDDPRLAKDLMTRGVDDIVYKPANYAAFAAKTKALVQRRKKAATQPGTTDANTPPTKTTVDGGRAATSTAPLSDRQCPVAPISRAEYERRLANVRHLFPLSSAAYDVFLLSQIETTTINTLVSAMLKDAALTTDVLRLANSVFYNRNHRPTIDVEEAVVRIGLKKVGEVALALNALGAFRSCILPWLDADLGQARSLAASIALERLCEAGDNRIVKDGMMLCAFLHPLGRLVLGSAFQDEYQSLIQASLERQASLSDLEVHVFPEHHTAALSRVLSQWNLPNGIWGPLRYLAESYDSIAQLEEPIRSRVELIKLAVFIGEIAVGRWMEWDQIEPPPRQLLARHQLSGLAPLIEQTRTDLGKLAGAQKIVSDDAGVGRPAHVKEDRVARVWYSEPSDRNEDWMPLLLAALGIETIPYESDKRHMLGGIVVNCLDAQPCEVAGAGRGQAWGNLEVLLLIARDAPSEMEQYGTTMRFPASIATLKARCGQLAKAITPSKLEHLSEPRGAKPSKLSVLA